MPALHTLTASWILDPDAYVRHGAFNDHTPAWGDTFRALGGERCVVTFGADAPIMIVVGTADALAFVEATVAA